MRLKEISVLFMLGTERKLSRQDAGSNNQLVLLGGVHIIPIGVFRELDPVLLFSQVLPVAMKNFPVPVLFLWHRHKQLSRMLWNLTNFHSSDAISESRIRFTLMNPWSPPLLVSHLFTHEPLLSVDTFVSFPESITLVCRILRRTARYAGRPSGTHST